VKSAIRLYLMIMAVFIHTAWTSAAWYWFGTKEGVAAEQATAHTRARAHAVAATNLEMYNSLMDLRTRKSYLSTMPNGCRPWLRGLKGMDPL
jgi:hypothetical protein